MKRKNWEDDKERWPSDAAYRIARNDGVAWRVYGWEIKPDEDTQWSGIYVRTGRVVAVMIGDDQRFTFDPDDVERIPDLAYCASCGQIGCEHDGRER